ncbi:hypothetical protein [Parapedobacter sp. 2B3]
MRFPIYLEADDYITHRLPFSRLREQFDTVVNPTALAIKTIVDMGA